jgi:hypothetical protein
MPERKIPDEVRDFISKHIDSVGQLEALLLLREHRDRRWNAATVAERLYAGEPETRELLKRLAEGGLLTSEGDTYGFATDLPAERLSTIDALATAYSRQLIPVTNIIHSKSRRIREFANAFRLRKDR